MAASSPSSRAEKQRRLTKLSRDARRALIELGHNPHQRAQRSEVVVSIVESTLQEAAVDIGVGVESETERMALRNELRAAIAEGIGALIRFAQDPCQKFELLLLLNEVANGNLDVRRRGIDVATEPYLRPGSGTNEVRSDELEELLAQPDSKRNRRALVAHLLGFSGYRRHARTRAYASALASRLDDGALWRLFNDQSGAEFIEAAVILVPHVSSALRKRLLKRAVDEQIQDGDQDSLIHLIGCMQWMHDEQIARIFAHMFAEYVTPEPSRRLIHLVRAHGDIYWMAPLIQHLGGDDALWATARVLCAIQRKAMSNKPST